MNLGENSYDIIVERGILAAAGQHLNLNRRVLVVTDSGVPDIYAKAVAAQCRNGVIITVESGEGSKSMEGFGKLLQAMLDGGLKKKARQDKALVDEISATIILQSYLESKKFKF